MCETTFKLTFTLDVMYEGKPISLELNRRKMNVIPPVGMHILFGIHSIEVIGLSAPFVFNQVICKCKMYKPFTEKIFNEFKGHGWVVTQIRPKLDNSNNMVTCPKCKGTGKALFTHEDVQTWKMKSCPKCNGTGYVYSDDPFGEAEQKFKNGVFIGE
jgi:hypothetical protein